MYETPIINIGQRSCQGYFACHFVGFDRSNHVEIGDDACDGTNACYYVGSRYATTYTKIGHGACVGLSACHYLGALSKYMVKVGLGSCRNGDRSCYRVGQIQEDDHRYKVDIDGYSCWGENSCYEIGTNHKRITVDGASCHGKDSCREETCGDVDLRYFTYVNDQCTY